MKKTALLLFSGLLFASTTSKAIVPAFVAPTTPSAHFAACIISLGGLCIQHSPVSIWLDPALIIATGLDLLATKDQQDKTVDAKDAINELEESLKGDGASGSGSGSESTDSSLSATDLDVLVPELVVKQLEKSADFDAVREAIEDYSFETTDASINGECKTEGKRRDNECAIERQNTWTLLSVTLAESVADKLLAISEDMSGRYGALISHFNEQTSPMGLWGAMNSITVDSHRQVNDINALYARDLEMNALATLNESGYKKYTRSQKTTEE